MQAYKKILVVIDPEDEKYIPLHRAAYLAHKIGAQITVLLIVYEQSLKLFSFVPNQYSDKEIEKVIRQQQHRLNVQLESLGFQDVVTSSKVCWHECPHQAIAEHVGQYDYDLVVKGTKHHNELSSLLITPSDWHLLRECRSSVLLVKPANWSQGGRILSAIDVDNNQAFNNEILQQSCFLADLLEAEHHLVNCYLEKNLSMHIAPPDSDHNEDHEKVKHQHQSAIDQAAQQYQIHKDNIHVMEGLSHYAIPHVAKDINAELVVLGTGNSSKISEALWGHTAEQVMEQLNCDLLALRPDNFAPH